jgi:hypothetical protein
VRRRIVAGALGAGACALSCRLLLGSLDECASDADCTARGAGLVCAGHLCVTPAAATTDRCAVLGPAAGDAIVFGVLLPSQSSIGSPRRVRARP